ncbi:MAG TPA: DUF222 domain-containing protein [Mycobacteriales bacterium]|nr:DUF222 domain-containing protein [Mycobacteriales bacterium]
MGNLASAVDELLAVDPRDVPSAALGEEIVELYRQVSRLQAAILERVEAFDRAGAAQADHGSTAAWLRAKVRLSPTMAGRDVHLGRDLKDVLPATRAALRDGVINPTQAQQIASLRSSIGDEALGKAEPHLVDFASRVSAKELTSAITHVKHMYGRERQDRDEQDDYAARTLHSSTTVGGMGVGNWVLHPAGQEIVQTAIHALSKPVPGDDRTPAQRRADALITMAELALRSGQLPVTGGVKPHVSVIVRSDTLADAPGAGAADYAFGATTSAEWARRFACDAAVSRIVIGPASEILDAGRTVRTFTAAQLRAIVARDRHCIWTGCDAPPGWCDGHHIRHWADGGSTDIDNGVLLCGRHHDRVHNGHHAIVKTPEERYAVDLRPGSDPTWTTRNRGGP